MSEPNYVLVRCPNGHELQAEQQHLHLALNCPVCGTNFIPAASRGSAAAPPAHPQELSYAGQVGASVTYPAYTIWMLALWIVGYAGQAVNGTIQAMNPALSDPNNLSANMATGIVMIFLGCSSSVAILTAAVMQLMWNHRIHADARNARGYNEISPGLALGLTFIPLFNWFWTPIIMRKLARFAQKLTPENPKHGETISAINWTLIFAVIGVLLACGSLVIVAKPMMEVMQASMSNPQAANSPDMQRKMAEAIPAWYTIGMQVMSLIGVGLFFRAVRMFEETVYPALGAPPR